ncbi:MAG: hypothetical protein ACRELS_21365 [Candidatus Rokuibacteriota bacterium]
MARFLPLLLLLVIPAGCAASMPSGARGATGASAITRADLVGRAAQFVTALYEKAYGVPLTGVELVAFDSAVPGAVKWRADPVTRGDHRMTASTKILVELPPGWVAQITTDTDARARELLASLRTTTDAACFWHQLREMYRSAGLSVATVDALEQRLRATAAQGRPQELVIATRDRTFVFNNNLSSGCCYTYALAGDWAGADQPQLYRAKTGRGLAGVLFLSDAHLRGY